MSGVPFLGPPKVRCGCNRVVGGDSESRVPLASHVFGNKEKLLIWAHCWLFGGLMGPPWVSGGWDSPLGPLEVG